MASRRKTVRVRLERTESWAGHDRLNQPDEGYRMKDTPELRQAVKAGLLSLVEAQAEVEADDATG